MHSSYLQLEKSGPDAQICSLDDAFTYAIEVAVNSLKCWALAIVAMFQPLARRSDVVDSTFKNIVS